MKKLLLIVYLLGATGSIWAMESQVLYEGDGVTITQQDADNFGNGTLTPGRFNEVYPTISKLVPKLQGYNYNDYMLAKAWAPVKLQTGASTLVAALKAQGQPQTQPTSSTQPSLPSATQPSTVQATTSSVSTSSTLPVVAASTQTATSASTVQSHAASSCASAAKKPAAKKPVVTTAAAKPQPQPIRQPTFWVVDTKYMIGTTCVVMALVGVYIYYERQKKDDEQAD